MRSVLSPSHPNVDAILRNPTANPLPSWHPPLEGFVARRSPVVLNVSVGAYHPAVDDAFGAGTAISANHPSVHAMFASVLSSTHPNLDAVLRDPANNPLPSNHPPLSRYVSRRQAVAFTVPVASFHPDTTTAFAAGTAISANHPSVHSLMRSVLSPSHPNVDAILRNPTANPLPSWHPPLEGFVARRSPVVLNVSVGAYHPAVDDAFGAGTAISANHPSVHAMFASVLSSTHPNLDAVLRDPANNPLPSNHPPLSRYVSRRQAVVFTIEVSNFHPNVDDSLAALEPMSDRHPSVHSLMTSVLSASHPNVDDILRNPISNTLPSWHPRLEQFITRRGGATSFDLPSVSIAWDHPDIDEAYLSATPMPQKHPSVGGLMRHHLPPNHPDVDELLRAPHLYPLPAWHPRLNAMVKRRSFWSPGLIFSLILAGLLLLAYALRIAGRFSSWRKRHAALFNRSESHDITYSASESKDSVYCVTNRAAAISHTSQYDAILAPPRESLGTCNTARSPPVMPMNGPSAPPSRTTLLQSSQRQKLLEVAPASAQQVSPGRKPPPPPPRQLPSAPYRLTENTQQQRVVTTAPAVCPRRHPPPVPPKPSPRHDNDLAWDNTQLHRTMRIKRAPPPPPPSRIVSKAAASYTLNVPVDTRSDDEAEAPTVLETPVETRMLPRRSLSIRSMHQRHRAHRAETAAYDFQEVDATIPRTQVTQKARELASSRAHLWWIRLTETRIPSSQWTTGNALFVFFYLAFNVVALFLAPTYSLRRGVGSLAAANTMFLVIPATRNNILTWFLGMAFDHIILHHRFLGRVTVALSLLHGALYFDELLQTPSQHVYWTGAAALGCGLGIAATTTDYVRRKLFNVFFWTHYLFFGFFGFAFFHVRQAQPFLITAIAIYAVDKVLRFLWTLLPHRTLMCRSRGDRTAQVRWPKNPLTRLMGKHRVGQYVFVNFPELSLTEWHPFSVSSGPGDDFVEVHIRALGNHTRRIVALAKQCEADRRQTLVRSDGPYGYLDFNYRRYGVLVLVGGGIGITPVISLLKDIYGDRRSEAAHCMQHVHVVWVMPHAAETELFLETLQRHQATAVVDPTLPSLAVKIHCTRADSTEVHPPVVAGRPNFPAIMDDAADRAPGTSTLVFACGPGRMVNQLWDECTSRNSARHRIDFHHETFEF